MKKAFIIYGTIICVAFAYASVTGVNFTDVMKSQKWSPDGKSAYHK